MPKKFPEEIKRDVSLGYANFAVADPPLKLVLIAIPGQGGSPNHLGVEVADTVVVDAGQARLDEAGFAARPERATTCCYARQDRFWVQDTPNGEPWEPYTALADIPTFAADADGQGGCCGTTDSGQEQPTPIAAC